MIELKIHKSINTSVGKMILTANAEIPENKITAIYGESGSGKTTLLRIIAGLATPEEGSIKVKGETWFSSLLKTNIKAQQRNIGFVFQDYALFPNMTVKQNIAFALKNKKDKSLVEKLMEEMNLDKFCNEYPVNLSGGQKQRVALARSLALEPKILLLDEPLSALDIETRIRLRNLISELHKKYKMTTILVSHDIPEIFALADNVLKIANNQLKDCGLPSEAFDKNLLKEQFRAVFD